MIAEVGGVAFRRFGFVQASVVSRWGDIVGGKFANLCTPESIRFPPGTREKGVLTIAAHGAHAPMLSHAAPDIIARVNRFFGYAAVARVVIRQSAGVARPSTAGRAPAMAQPNRALGQDVDESLRAITDDGLRTVLEALAQGLANRAHPPEIATIPVRGKVR